MAISRRANTALRAGMVLSNEPGFYKPRHYGIRLENMQYVVELFEISTPDTKMYGFEALTLACTGVQARVSVQKSHDLTPTRWDSGFGGARSGAPG